uniref:DB domain-containing protein n=1 Tax=Strongyloides venezuelensis TaxID=75913 RepID=A0A0K0FS94_STRVS
MIKVLFSIIFTLVIFIESTEGCFAFGGCGLGLGLLMNPYSLRYCNARAKAKSSNTFKEDDDKIVEEDNYLENGYSKDIPNKFSTSPDDKFLECCQNRGLSKTCQNICSYTNYTKKTLQEMYFNVNGCPLSEISNIHFCASGGKDHKSCCINKGVSLTSSGDRCLIFCDTEPAVPMQLDLSYVNCYDKFDQMKECFLKETITKSWNNFDIKNQDIQYDSNDENYKRFKTNTGGSSWF